MEFQLQKNEISYADYSMFGKIMLLVTIYLMRKRFLENELKRYRNTKLIFRFS